MGIAFKKSWFYFLTSNDNDVKYLAKRNGQIHRGDFAMWEAPLAAPPFLKQYLDVLSFSDRAEKDLLCSAYSIQVQNL